VDRLHFDLSGFFNVYDQLRGSSRGTPFPNDPLAPTYLIVPLTAINDTRGNTFGAELTTTWQVIDGWRWRLGYSYLGMDMRGSDAADLEGWSPEHQVFAQSLSQLPANLEFDVTFRFVDELSGPDIPAYFTADVRLGWRPREDLELSVVGQNLLDSPHQEFRSSLIGYNPSVITRAIFGRITWSF
jgi:iron complex outermembrane receptor protein